MVTFNVSLSMGTKFNHLAIQQGADCNDPITFSHSNRCVTEIVQGRLNSEGRLKKYQRAGGIVENICI